jgi:hypothetical protein
MKTSTLTTCLIKREESTSLTLVLRSCHLGTQRGNGLEEVGPSMQALIQIQKEDLELKTLAQMCL